jgi:hypothetical protein
MKLLSAAGKQILPNMSNGFNSGMPTSGCYFTKEIDAAGENETVCRNNKIFTTS